MTPAPWIVETHATKYSDLFTYNVVAPQGWTDHETKQHQTCTVASGLDEGEDARLIAAAPDLLAALQYIATADSGIGDSFDKQRQLSECIRTARAAIAKAEGKP